MESHPYTKPRGVGPVTTELTPSAEPTAAQPPIDPGNRDGAAIRIETLARHYQMGSAIIRAVASSVLSVCMTPLGSPVVPEVKGRYIT